LIPWRYKVTWGERSEEVTILFGDLARFEVKVGKAYQQLLDEKAWTSYCDALLVYTCLQRLKIHEQSFDDFLDTADVELVQYGEATQGKAPRRAASSGRSRRSPSSAA
jgi:hypothetical protein